MENSQTDIELVRAKGVFPAFRMAVSLLRAFQNILTVLKIYNSRYECYRFSVLSAHLGTHPNRHCSTGHVYDHRTDVHDGEHSLVMLILRIIKTRPRSCNPRRRRRRRRRV